jgi:hypothetical protein
VYSCERLLRILFHAFVIMAAQCFSNRGEDSWGSGVAGLHSLLLLLLMGDVHHGASLTHFSRTHLAPSASLIIAMHPLGNSDSIVSM